MPAIVSILHRISGVILFLLIPLMLWGLRLSLTSETSFNDLHDYLTTSYVKFILWCCLSALIYHVVAGVRHILMDMGIGEELKSGKVSAVLTLLISVVFIILTGVWLW
jgi:succinate dehydrogenase / fumarate reductase, cytochrome b subunit